MAKPSSHSHEGGNPVFSLWSLFFALIIGAALPFAFAPFNIYSLAFLAPAALFFIWLRAKPWQALLQGLLFGIGFFGVGTSWIYISIHNFGNASAPLSIFITSLFVLFMSLYPALQGYLGRRLFQHKHEAIQCFCVFPVFWVLFEALRGWLFTGFPWLFLGYSQINTPLHALAPLFGIYGVSLATVLISGAVALLALPKRNTAAKISSVIVILVIVCTGWLLSNRHWTEPAGKSIKVSIVQGNIAQEMKWRPAQLINILNIYKNLTDKYWGSKLIIWPEAAVPTYPQDVDSYFKEMNKAAKLHNDYLIIGSPIYNEKTQKFYNGLTLLGAGKGRYLKRHLVPFGEYVPLQSIFGKIMKDFNIPMSNFSSGPKKQKLLSVRGFNIAAFICYEIAYSHEVLRYSKGSQMIVNISDDSWFGQSKALGQQAQMGQMRALETGRPVVLNANTGISAFINPLGKITKKTAIDKRVVLTEQVTPMKGKTPLMRWHYYPVLAVLLLLLIIAISSSPSKKRNSEK